MDILEAILDTKEKYSDRVKKLQEELKSLENVRMLYEKTEIKSNDNDKIISDLEEKIKKHEISIQNYNKKFKEISKKATTIKSSNTKILKKEKLLLGMIEEILTENNLKNENSEKEERNVGLALKFKNLIETLKGYKEQGIINIPQIDDIEAEIPKLDNESLQNIFNKMQSAVRVLKGAVTAKNNAIEKFNMLTNLKKVDVKKVVKERTKSNENESKNKKRSKSKRNFAESRKNKRNLKLQDEKSLEEDIIQKLTEIKETEQTDNEKEVENTQKENKKISNNEMQIDDTIKKIIEEKLDLESLKNKSLDEIIKNAEEIKFYLCNNGYMLHVAEQVFNYIIEQTGKSDEYSKRKQETFFAWSGMQEYINERKQEDDDNLANGRKIEIVDDKIKNEETTLSNSASTNVPKKEQENEQKKEPKDEKIGKEKSEEKNKEKDSQIENKESNSVVKQDYSIIKKNIEDTKKSEKQQDIKLEPKEMENIYSSGIAKANINKIKNEKKSSIKHDEKKVLPFINRIKILESERKVEVDGKKIEINRYLDLETEKTVDDIFNRVMNLNGRISKKQSKKIKKYIDPAIVNAIKDTYLSKSNQDKWNKTIANTSYIRNFAEDKKNKNIFFISIKDDQEVNLEVQDALNEKKEAEKIFKKILYDYIKSISYLDWNFNPFGEIVYDCSGSISKSEYRKIEPYLKTTENIGGYVIGKRGIFGLIKEGKKGENSEILDETKNTKDTEPMQKYKEGDKSFVEKVTTR